MLQIWWTLWWICCDLSNLAWHHGNQLCSSWLEHSLWIHTRWTMPQATSPTEPVQKYDKFTNAHHDSRCWKALFKQLSRKKCSCHVCTWNHYRCVAWWLTFSPDPYCIFRPVSPAHVQLSTEMKRKQVASLDSFYSKWSLHMQWKYDDTWNFSLETVAKLFQSHVCGNH